MAPDWSTIYQQAEDVSELALEGRLRPEASSKPARENAAYLLAVDVADDVAATLFAVLNAYPDIDPGMWCLAFLFRRGARGWVEQSEGAGETAPDPFFRPEPQNSTSPWVDWLIPGGATWTEEHGWSHMVWGIATTATHRITIRPGAESERELQITPFSGAFVAAVPSALSILTGYDQAGERIGTSSYAQPGRLASGEP
jgi:hypothetical protein